jgi:hypothetical protein
VSEAVFETAGTIAGACLTFRGKATIGAAAMDASSAASLSAASVAARSVLRSDDEVLLRCTCNARDVRARNREKRPFSRPTDSGSDSADCSGLGNRKCGWIGRIFKSSGGLDGRREVEMLGGMEVARVDGIDAAWREGVATGDLVKGICWVGGRLTGTRGNESTEDGGRETGRLLRIELGVCGREGAE